MTTRASPTAGRAPSAPDPRWFIDDEPYQRTKRRVAGKEPAFQAASAPRSACEGQVARSVGEAAQSIWRGKRSWLVHVFAHNATVSWGLANLSNRTAECSARQPCRCVVKPPLLHGNKATQSDAGIAMARWSGVSIARAMPACRPYGKLRIRPRSRNSSSNSMFEEGSNYHAH